MEKLPNWLVVFILTTVTVVWAASMIGDMLSDSFSVSPAIHVLMTTVAGVATGQQIVISRTKRRRKEDDGA